jgi:Kef-type K+ transport system membrane component KefB
MNELLEFIHQSPLYELTALLAFSSIAGLIGLFLRQPMVVSFIAVGILAGPSALGLVKSKDHIELLAELGIALLLFLVGLKLDLKLIKTLGTVAIATGLGQVAFTSIAGFMIGLALGLDVITSVYVAIALTFSSTIIIIKLLTDKREVDSLHGKIALGFLIVQDLVVVIAMMVLSAFGVQGEADGNALYAIGQTLIYGVIMLGFLSLFIRFVATPLMRKVTRSAELVIIFAIAWAAVLAGLGHELGFSKELGGLLAGISLASTPFREAIVARMSSLRDFLLLFFFIALGSHLDISNLGAQISPAIVFSLFVLIGNPLIVMVIMGFMGYRKRTSFSAGLTVAQISEFSLIFIAMGISLNHIGEETLGLVTLVGLVTIALSVYMITYSQQLFAVLAPALGFFERKNPFREVQEGKLDIENQTYDIIIFGAGRMGAAIADKLVTLGHKILAIDFDPDIVKRDSVRDYTIQFGDAYDPDFLAHLPLTNAKWVISAIPQHDTGLAEEDPRVLLLDCLSSQNFNGKVAVATHKKNEKDFLSSKGADYVFLPYEDAANCILEKIKAVPL